MDDSNAVMTGDGKHVIICHPLRAEGYYTLDEKELVKSSIFIIDVENGFKWRRSSIKCPVYPPKRVKRDQRTLMCRENIPMMFRTDNMQKANRQSAFIADRELDLDHPI